MGAISWLLLTATTLIIFILLAITLNNLRNKKEYTDPQLNYELSQLGIQIIPLYKVDALEILKDFKQEERLKAEHEKRSQEEERDEAYYMNIVIERNREKDEQDKIVRARRKDIQKRGRKVVEAEEAEEVRLQAKWTEEVRLQAEEAEEARLQAEEARNSECQNGTPGCNGWTCNRCDD